MTQICYNAFPNFQPSITVAGTVKTPRTLRPRLAVLYSRDEQHGHVAGCRAYTAVRTAAMSSQASTAAGNMLPLSHALPAASAAERRREEGLAARPSLA